MGKERIEIGEDVLDIINGGNINYDPLGDGTYLATPEHGDGQVYIVKDIGSIILIAQHRKDYGLDTNAGEVKALEWAVGEHLATRK